MILTKKWFFLSVLLCSASALAVEDALVKQADGLLKNGKAQEAYTLLAPYESERAGDPDYDYRLGISALDHGKPNEAIFALERVLAVKPDHLQARAEIARAYLATGETAASKQEFETVKKQNPPSEVSATIQKFLDAIETTTAGERTTMRGYLEAALGADSNVNSATDNRQVAIPAFGGLIMTLSASGVKQDDSYASIAGGFNVRHPLSPEWGIFGGANFNQRTNSSQDIFDTQSLDGNLGVSLTKGNDVYSAAAQLQSFSVDNSTFRDTAGLTAQWQRNLDSGSQASAYFQYSDLHYPGANSIRDADRYVAGAAFARALGGLYTPVVYVGGYAGEEKEQRANVAHLGHRLAGVRAGGEMKLNSKTVLFGSASLESRNYGGQDPMFLVDRRDTQADLRLGVSYIAAPNWKVTPQFSYTRNDSNVIINDYDRAALNISLRRDFN